MTKILISIFVIIYINLNSYSFERTDIIEEKENKKVSFWEAYSKLRKWEGNYGWHAEDPGGETYAGIARRYNRNWTGWAVIDIYKRDSIKRGHNIPHNKYISSVEPIVEKYYLKRWIKFQYYNLKDQKLANYIFDYHNQGPAAAIHISQLISEKDSTFEITNRFSPTLISKLSNVDSTFVEELRKKRANYYIVTVRKRPHQRKFLKGWLRRTNDVD